jgi:alkanesulfonate monooxygenase SsuD/methylene tetrahydromethanopterin reductase-like flavin-dependent oxidoreductase (luciferase family)
MVPRQTGAHYRHFCILTPRPAGCQTSPPAALVGTQCQSAITHRKEAIPERPIIRQVFVAPTMQKAEALAAPAIEHLYREVYGKASAAGDRTLRNDDGSAITDHNQVSFDTFKARYIVGTPEFAIDEIRKYRDGLGCTEMVCWMHMPGIRGADVMTSVELFAREVMPAFRQAR